LSTIKFGYLIKKFVKVDEMDYAAIAYAVVVAAGGVMGFVKKGSIMSGLMGLAFGGLLGKH
jgi:uncharacterized membrane protein (UPF0136 family)